MSPAPVGRPISGVSQLQQWPCQIKLAPVNGPYFDGADLLIAADCTAFAYGSFHNDFMRNRITLIGCPKLDGVNYAEKLGFDKNDQKNESLRVGEVPFDSMRKMMSTVHRTADGTLIQFTKGAPDELLRRCTSYLSEEGVLPLTEEKRAEFLSENKAMADQALRVLACAYRELSEIPAVQDSETLEKELVFLGLCGMIDPVRPEVKAAVDAIPTKITVEDQALVQAA